MRATQLQPFNDWLSSTVLLQDRLWQRELSQISEMEIQLFYARAGLHGARAQALEAIDRLQSTLILKAVEGALGQDDMRLIEHEVPDDIYCVDEFIDGLVQLTPARRAATLFALERGMSASQVTELSWYAAGKLTQLTPNAQEILLAQSRIRHLRLPYVFWEWQTPVIATCLTGLEDDVERAMGKRWPALQVAFTSMLWVSGRADASSFLQFAEEARVSQAT
jgi:hypothetical protein